MNVEWRRIFSGFIRRIKRPSSEPCCLREQERERELGMQQVREMMSPAGDTPAGREAQKKK